MIGTVALVENQGFIKREVLPPLDEALGSRDVFDNKMTRLRISMDEWFAEDADLLRFDEAVHRLEDSRIPFCLVLEGLNVEGLAVTQVLTRYQRLLPLESAAKQSPVLKVLGFHGALFDTSKPLVRADYDHALDTWRWVLRLDANASFALQLAALLHDIERLASEADERVEHLAPDYLEFKRRHAAASAAYLTHFLTEVGLPSAMVRRVCELVSSHEQPQQDVELTLLNDADSLSFFSLNSWGFVRYFGEAHTRTKVRYTVRRMSQKARTLLPTIRQHPCVSDFLREYAGQLS